MNNTFNYKKAFSLVEISIVCGVLMILLIPVFTMMSQGNKSTVQNRNELLANEYALNIISYVNLINYDDIFFQHYDSNYSLLGDELILDDGHGKKINLNDLGESFEGLRNLKPEVYIKIIDNPGNTSNWSYKCRVVSVKIEWKEPGLTNKQVIEKTGLVTE